VSPVADLLAAYAVALAELVIASGYLGGFVDQDI
jgi:hypothetical protein